MLDGQSKPAKGCRNVKCFFNPVDTFDLFDFQFHEK